MKDDDGPPSPAEAWLLRSRGMISHEEYVRYASQNDPTFDPGGDPLDPSGRGGGRGTRGSSGGIGCVIVGLAMIGTVAAGAHEVAAAIEGRGQPDRSIVDTRGGNTPPPGIRRTRRTSPLSLSPRGRRSGPAEVNEPPGP